MNIIRNWRPEQRYTDGGSWWDLLPQVRWLYVRKSMTVSECYEKMNGDYDDVLRRLQSESLVERFLLKFPAEQTVPTLRKASSDGDVDACFAATHTLKSVAGSLGFTDLYRYADLLCEQLRPRTTLPDPELLQQLNLAYDRIIDTILKYQQEKA